MGFFSFNCKECKHPMLSRCATDPGINDWMTQVVALLPDGSRVIGRYDGYGCVDGCVDNMEDDDLHDAAFLHLACWEVAGKPKYSAYGSPSDNANDQGYFFDDTHDFIDPRIKEDREKLLQAGIDLRNKRRFEHNANDVRDWMKEGQGRFKYSVRYEDGVKLENKWWLIDAFGERFKSEDDGFYFDGTEDEVKAHCEALWQTFVESPECHVILVHGS